MKLKPLLLLLDRAPAGYVQRPVATVADNEALAGAPCGAGSVHRHHARCADTFADFTTPRIADAAPAGYVQRAIAAARAHAEAAPVELEPAPSTVTTPFEPVA